MNSAIDVADYILDSRGSQTGYQLQKLLYYCQAWHLVAIKEPLFSEALRAYAHGPAVMEVSMRHFRRRTVRKSDIRGNKDNLSESTKLFVDNVLDSYAHLSGDELEQLTHQEEPWTKNFNGYNGAAAATIPTDEVFEYYVKLSAADAETKRRHCVPSMPNAAHVYISDEDYEWLSAFLDEE